MKKNSKNERPKESPQPFEDRVAEGLKRLGRSMEGSFADKIKTGLEAVGYDEIRYVEILDRELSHGGSRTIRALTFIATFFYGLSRPTGGGLPRPPTGGDDDPADSPEVKAMLGEDEDDD